MTQAVTYERETKSVAFQGKIIVLESLTPVLPPKEKEQRKKEIERCLFEVFSKYGDRSRKTKPWLCPAYSVSAGHSFRTKDRCYHEQYIVAFGAGRARNRHL